MNLQEPSGSRRASNKTLYLLVLVPIVAIIATGGGLCYFVTLDAENVTQFKEGFRFPESVPDHLGRAGGAYANAGRLEAGEQLPYVKFNWEVCADNADPKAALFLSVAQEHQLVDLEGQSRTAVEVDGVEGWLSRLDAQDFVAPGRDHPDYEGYRELPLIWGYDRYVYYSLLGSRRHLQGNRAGPAIALQWNREGIHYLLFATDREPFSPEVLMRIANSMAPSPYPEYNEITPARKDSPFGNRCPA